MKRNNKKKETFIVVTIFAERSTVVHRNLRRAKIRLLSICLERDVSLVKRGKIFRRTIFHSRRIRRNVFPRSDIPSIASLKFIHESVTLHQLAHSIESISAGIVRGY